jgi:hypothetical protein
MLSVLDDALAEIKSRLRKIKFANYYDLFRALEMICRVQGYYEPEKAPPQDYAVTITIPLEEAGSAETPAGQVHSV